MDAGADFYADFLLLFLSQIWHSSCQDPGQGLRDGEAKHVCTAETIFERRPSEKLLHSRGKSGMLLLITERTAGGRGWWGGL